ncbi:hypothetical protein [Helicobacter sp. T3_23-1059]
MYNHGFFALFLIIAFVFGTIMLVFGVVARSMFGVRPPKPKQFSLKDFRELIPTAKDQKKALELVDMFIKKFNILAPQSPQKQEWLDTVKELVSLDSIDTDKAAEVRERLISKNPNLQNDITQLVGNALKNKKA